jgi:hypothetical protein
VGFFAGAHAVARLMLAGLVTGGRAQSRNPRPRPPASAAASVWDPIYDYGEGPLAEPAPTPERAGGR